LVAEWIIVLLGILCCESVIVEWLLKITAVVRGLNRLKVARCLLLERTTADWSS